MHLVEGHHPLQDGNSNTYNLILEWPWPWDDLDLGHHTNTISWPQQNDLVFNSKKNQFYQSDLDLDPMTLVLKLDLGMVKMYHHTKK